jgi:hypothetical protein
MAELVQKETELNVQLTEHDKKHNELFVKEGKLTNTGVGSQELEIEFVYVQTNDAMHTKIELEKKILAIQKRIDNIKNGGVDNE